EGVRVKFSAGKRTVIDGPSARLRRSSPATGTSGAVDGEGHRMWAKRLPFEAGGEPAAEREADRYTRAAGATALLRLPVTGHDVTGGGRGGWAGVAPVRWTGQG